MGRKITVFVFLLCAAVPSVAQSNLVFPQIAVGGNPAYETVLQIINEVEAGNPITIDVFQGKLSGSANGTPLAVRFDGASPVASRTVALSPFQELTTIMTIDGSTLRNGWVRVRSTLGGGKVSGNLIFRQRSGNALVDSVGATSPQQYRRAVIQVDQRESGSDTGLAFVNPDSTPVSVTLDLFQALDRVASPLIIKLQPNEHFAKLLSEMFPSFGSRQGTLVIETDPGRSIPCMALRLDGIRTTSIPVRPLGFVFQYTVSDSSSAVIETGLWMFDMVGLNLVGTGKVETPSAGDLSEVTGSWTGTNFQFRYRKTIGSGNVGMVIFNGTSAGSESTAGSDGKGKLITGKVTTLGSDGQVVSVNNFTAYHRFGASPQ